MTVACQLLLSTCASLDNEGDCVLLLCCCTVVFYNDFLSRQYAGVNNVDALVQASEGYLAARPKDKVVVGLRHTTVLLSA